MQFNLKTAQAYASDDILEEWIHAYLTTGEWANPDFSDGLKLQKRWWVGPVEVSLEILTRCCGPEPEMAYRMNPVDWDRRVTKIADNLVDVTQLPPLIIEYQASTLRIADGNHRHEAIRRKGWSRCWVLIWYDDHKTWQASPYHA